MLANSGWSWQLFAAPVLWIGWARKTPVIIIYRGGEARDYCNKSIKWVRPSLNKAAAIVAPSGFLKKVFSDFNVDAQVIPNIINLERFKKGTNNKQISTQYPHLIVTRNLEAIYGIATAIKAVALLRKTIPGIKLSIAGSGPQKEELQRLVVQENLQKNVYFTGKLNPDEMAELYRHADIMLNPTTVDNMPNSVIEALASGVAVVTTNVGGIPYMVEDDKTALFTAKNNPADMAKQINRLLNDTDLYHSLVNNGLNEAQKYTWEKIGNSWLKLYQSVVGSRVTIE
jgi:glycosyltransferase involved in cell wall biosynthesis